MSVTGEELRHTAGRVHDDDVNVCFEV